MSMFNIFNSSDGKFIERGVSGSEDRNNRHFNNYNASIGAFVASILMFLGALAVCLRNANNLMSSNSKRQQQQKRKNETRQQNSNTKK